MKFLICSDDGYRGTIHASEGTTAAQICENFCRLRYFQQPGSLWDIEPVDCLLAIHCLGTEQAPESNQSTTCSPPDDFISGDTTIGSVLDELAPLELKNVRLLIYGFRYKSMRNAFDQISQFSSKIALMSLTLNAARDTISSAYGTTKTPLKLDSAFSTSSQRHSASSALDISPSIRQSPRAVDDSSALAALLPAAATAASAADQALTNSWSVL